MFRGHISVSWDFRQSLELTKRTCRDLLLSKDHGLDSAKAVVEALLDGVERQQLAGRGMVVPV
ncbi:hypothetical protein IAE39_003602 [Pseudomonas sp. S37]|uniref:hypothetical protein n=1 Tax=Pseudomonas sp. S37 TaxID=2767449 RepID=UPI001F30B761|nr:hypothetical protein [Pseudomonas sp. S37]MBK4995428.1 hypothetical protein [Pseudomonas sp. S37]